VVPLALRDFVQVQARHCPLNMSQRGEQMREFWDERAREDALYFVDNRIPYQDPEAEELFWSRGREDLDRFLASLSIGIEPGDEVVEIGCGVGRLTRVIAERATSVKALDISSEMLAEARRHNPELQNVEWIQGDGVSLAGVADASADLVISHVVFQHIPDPEVTLGYVREIGRVLRPGGRAAIQVSNDPAVHSWRFGWKDRLKQRLRIGPRGQSNPAWLGSAVELPALREAAADGGMKVENLAGEGTQYMVVLLRRE
jgi:SAM-dependent methyltransferase